MLIFIQTIETFRKFAVCLGLLPTYAVQQPKLDHLLGYG